MLFKRRKNSIQQNGLTKGPYKVMMNGYDEYRALFYGWGDGSVFNGSGGNGHAGWWPLSSWNKNIGIAIEAIEKSKSKVRKDKIYREVEVAAVYTN